MSLRSPVGATRDPEADEDDSPPSSPLQRLASSLTMPRSPPESQRRDDDVLDSSVPLPRVLQEYAATNSPGRGGNSPLITNDSGVLCLPPNTASTPANNDEGDEGELEEDELPTTPLQRLATDLVEKHKQVLILEGDDSPGKNPNRALGGRSPGLDTTASSLPLMVSVGGSSSRGYSPSTNSSSNSDGTGWWHDDSDALRRRKPTAAAATHSSPPPSKRYHSAAEAYANRGSVQSPRAGSVRGLAYVGERCHEDPSCWICGACGETSFNTFCHNCGARCLLMATVAAASPPASRAAVVDPSYLI